MYKRTGLSCYNEILQIELQLLKYVDYFNLIVARDETYDIHLFNDKIFVYDFQIGVLVVIKF